MECEVDGCISAKFRRGLCGRHYHLAREADAPRCSEPGCVRKVHGRGLCDRHYREKVRSQTTPCVITGCGRPSVSGGLCGSHRKRKARHGFLETTRPADWGGKEKHPLYGTWAWQRKKSLPEDFGLKWRDDFWHFVEMVGERPEQHRLHRLDPTKPLGPDNFEWRKPVLSVHDATSHRDYMRKWSRQYRDANPEKFAAYEFRKRYGMTYQQYNEKLAEQDGVCAICRQPETAESPRTRERRKLAVDHCHAGGHVRGLLCTNCNLGLGGFRDNLDTIRAAIAYLERHAEMP
jgi:hypothetical protein